MDELSSQKYLTSGYAPLFCCTGWDQFGGSVYPNDSDAFLNESNGVLYPGDVSEKCFGSFSNLRQANKLPSLVDRIQLDFPRTPSFVIGPDEEGSIRAQNGCDEMSEETFKSCLDSLVLPDIDGQNKSSDADLSQSIYPMAMSSSMGCLESGEALRSRDYFCKNGIFKERGVSVFSSLNGERSSGMAKKNSGRRGKSNDFQKYSSYAFCQSQRRADFDQKGLQKGGYHGLSKSINYSLGSDVCPSTVNSLDLHALSSVANGENHLDGYDNEYCGDKCVFSNCENVSVENDYPVEKSDQMLPYAVGTNVRCASADNKVSSQVPAPLSPIFLSSKVENNVGLNVNGVVKSSSRSSLLEEFRTSKNKKFDLKDIIDHFVEFSGDQHGSRFIQQKLETASAAEKQLVFHEIYPYALHLMTDVFGNYVIQKFFEYGTVEQKQLLGESLKGNVLYLSLQMYGCRVIQKALEVISKDQKAKLVNELNGHVLKCIKDQNGNHVIQKVIEHVSAELVLFVVNTFKGKVCSLAVHPYGCRVIQRILEHCGNVTGERVKEPGIAAQLEILDELLNGTIDLVQDQYGNYVIQHVLEHGRKEDKRKIIRNLEGKIVQLSQHKFASNVIEKCVQYGTYEDRKMIIDEVLCEKLVPGTRLQSLEVMMNDAYANYVVQKILEVCEPDQRDLLVCRIKPHINSLKKFTYSKHILLRMEKILGKSL